MQFCFRVIFWFALIVCSSPVFAQVPSSCQFICLNAPCTSDLDLDGYPDECDACVSDPTKNTDVGECGCGRPEIDTDQDRFPDCVDECPLNPQLFFPSSCGSCDLIEPDVDADGTPDCFDLCPDNPELQNTVTSCGCTLRSQLPDTDADGVKDCEEQCPNDPLKTTPGYCGCGVVDGTDQDLDAVPACADLCPADRLKSAPGVCGCGISDIDTDKDGVIDCIDSCPQDRLKINPGQCGCGTRDLDSDLDGTVDCLDGCPADTNKTRSGICGCNQADLDLNSNFIVDCLTDKEFDFSVRSLKRDLSSGVSVARFCKKAAVRYAVSGERSPATSCARRKNALKSRIRLSVATIKQQANTKSSRIILRTESFPLSRYILEIERSIKRALSASNSQAEKRYIEAGNATSRLLRAHAIQNDLPY